MDRFLGYARQKQKEIIAFTRELVECESPSDNPAAVAELIAKIARGTRDIAKVNVSRGTTYGPNARFTFTLPGRKKEGQILALGHSDTVWPMGTLAKMPFRQSRGRLWGPGVLDMKAGLVFFIFAMRALRDLNVEMRRNVVLQINADEEVGSDSSRAWTEEAAKKSVAVLVLEPGTGITGKLKTARKGVGDYTVTVRGVASHAGVDFSNGANAIVEMSRQLQQIAGFTKLDRGVTVSPGVVQGGTRSNVVAAQCRAHIDIRAPRDRDRVYLERAFGSLKPFDRRCTIEVTGGLNRPPMERSAGVRKLFNLAKELAADLGVDLEESATGGGSDGNFTAALGVPTLDGLGAVGEGAHAVNESILIGRIADRTALLAKLVAAI